MVRIPPVAKILDKASRDRVLVHPQPRPRASNNHDKTSQGSYVIEKHGGGGALGVGGLMASDTQYTRVPPHAVVITISPLAAGGTQAATWAQIFCQSGFLLERTTRLVPSVSYTHLTLPTTTPV